MVFLPNYILDLIKQYENTNLFTEQWKDTCSSYKLFLEDVSKQYEAFKISDFVKEQEKVIKNTEAYLQPLIDDIKKQNSIYTDVYKLNELNKNLYISYNKKEKRSEISDNKEGKNSIPIETAKDVLILKNIIDDLSFAECSEFINFLSKYPMLGFKHPIGSKIYSFIEKIPKETINSTDLYRIRQSTEQKQIAYTESEMFEPQYGFPMQNRFSMVGLNPLYLTSDLNTALLETGTRESDKYTFMNVQLKNNFDFLNITNEQIPLFNFCHKRTENKQQNLKVEYLIPNYISDCSKANGFEGIIYNSVYKINALNYVFFNAGKRDFTVKKLEGKNYEKA